MIAERQNPVLTAGVFLWLFAVIGTTLVAFTETGTRELIVANERALLERNLRTLLPAGRFDNDIVADHRQLPPAALLGTEVESTVYRARLAGEPVAAVFSSVAPNGYSGRIDLLVGVYLDGRLAGVRVIRHTETPGLGDGIEARKSSWIESFAGKSLGDPPAARWAVRRDGGDFDQLTGATITPRAVVGAVRNTLLYYRDNAAMIFQ